MLGALVRRTCPPARAGGAEYVPVPAEEEDERWRERTRSQLFAATAGSKPASRRRPSRWQREKSTADRRGHDRAERPGPRPKARPVSRGTKPSARLLRVVGSEGGSAQILYRSSPLLSKLTGMPEFLEA